MSQLSALPTIVSLNTIVDHVNKKGWSNKKQMVPSFKVLFIVPLEKKQNSVTSVVIAVAFDDDCRLPHPHTLFSRSSRLRRSTTQRVCVGVVTVNHHHDHGQQLLSFKCVKLRRRLQIVQTCLAFILSGRSCKFNF